MYVSSIKSPKSQTFSSSVKDLGRDILKYDKLSYFLTIISKKKIFSREVGLPVLNRPQITSVIYKMATLTKKKKYSKKSKKNWRKHTDIKDVEEFLDEQRQEERTGSVFLPKMSWNNGENDDLFNLVQCL